MTFILSYGIVFLFYHPFISTWRLPFKISYKVDLVVMNSLRFFFFGLGKCLSFPHSWSAVLSCIVFLVCNFLLALLACKIFFLKSTGNLVGYSLYMMVCISLAAFQVLSLSFENLIIMCHCGFLWMHLF